MNVPPEMNAFDPALQFVHESLEGLRQQGRTHLRADSAALTRLMHATPPPAAAIAPPLEPKPEPAPTPIVSQPLPPTAPTANDMPPANQQSAISNQPSTSRPARLAALRAPILSCTKCPHLVRSRTQVVFGVGNPEADLMFVGEAPGADEDRQGEPFVGAAGQLLTKIIQAMGFERGDVYIANILKCRPDMPAGQSGNRPPTPDEMATCLPYLREQIAAIQPRVLVALGSTAVRGLLDATGPMASIRGRWHSFAEIPLMPTYHPAYLLRNQSLSEKRKVWDDMLQVLERLERPISQKQRNYFLTK